MRVRLEIVRRRSANDEPYEQRIDFDYDDEGMTVALALIAINEDASRHDVDGSPFTPIRWECSCLQKKCGSCAMVINASPRAACDTKLAEFDSGVIRLEPLRKFPVIADLIVDRSQMRAQLKDMKLWLEADADFDEENTHVAYEASRCLQCGCCLEVCPNFYFGGSFAGPASTTVNSKLLAAASASQQGVLAKTYRKRIFSGCGKSLACMDICPAEIPLEGLLVRSNAAAVWRRKSLRKDT